MRAGYDFGHTQDGTVVRCLLTSSFLALLGMNNSVTDARQRQGRDRFLLIIAAGIGTIAAYASSETIKLLVTEERPCRAIAIDTVSACPEVGDWSWPSNHATIAAALATACVLAIRRLWPLVAALTLLIALSRVAAGVHYVHDTLSGITLGIVVTVTVGSFVNAGLQRLRPRGASDHAR